MKSQWNDSAARETVEAYAAKGVGPDVGAPRLHHAPARPRSAARAAWRRQHLGEDARRRDDLGQEHEVIAVKGSGADMADIEPWGLPAVKLEPLRELRALEALSDEAMVNVQRLNLLDSARAQPLGRDAAACLPAA